MRVLVLDGHVNPAVISVRSLARAKHCVFVGSTESWSKAGWSRFCSGTFVYPNPRKDTRAFAQCIADQAAREQGTFVLPLTEATAMVISDRRSLVAAAGGRVVMPPHSTMLCAYDKLHTTHLAASVGLAAPRTLLLDSTADAERLAPDFPYPAALKARTSVEFRGPYIQATARTRYARNAEEFLEAYQELRKYCTSVLAQEFIDGAGVLYCALLWCGELRAEFAYRRVRSVHPTGWGAALRVSVPSDSLREPSLAIVRALDPNWTGLAQVEYRVRSDGTPVFLEVNPRCWNSMPLAVYAGVDFPAMLARMAEQGDIGLHPGYPAGVMCRWWLADLRNVLYTWRGVPASYPAPTTGRLSALVGFLKPVPNAYHDNFTLDDPLPELGDWLGAGLRALKRATDHAR